MGARRPHAGGMSLDEIIETVALPRCSRPAGVVVRLTVVAMRSADPTVNVRSLAAVLPRRRRQWVRPGRLQQPIRPDHSRRSIRGGLSRWPGADGAHG